MKLLKSGTGRLILFACLQFVQTACAQTTGKIDYPNLGLSFEVPNAWAAQEIDAGFIMMSESTPGFVLILTHDIKDLVTLEKEASEGFLAGNDTDLQLNGELEKISYNSIAGEYSGFIDGELAKSYLIGMVNQKGLGLTILTATYPSQYSEMHKKIGVQVAQSVKFYTAKAPEVSSEWHENLKDSRLTYMDSYSSTLGGYGGYSNKTIIELCSAGYFNFITNNSLSVDVGSATGSSYDAGKGSGSWRVIKHANGQALLQLKFSNGELYEYSLTTNDEDQTFLNGERYFKTYEGGDYAPDCD